VRPLVRPVVPVAIALLLGGCATVSDDPHEGGLMGWMVHGPSGYQKRIDERQGQLEATHQQTAAEAEKTRTMEAQRAAIEKRIADLEARLAELHQQTDALAKDLERVKAENAGSEAAKAKLEKQLDGLRKDMEALQNNPDLLLREKEERMKQLQDELKTLRERTEQLLNL
jgi:chromosome segregation ATPase